MTGRRRRRSSTSRSSSGRSATDGKHEVATVLQRIDLGDRVAIEPAPALAVDGFAGDTLVRGALDALAAAAGVEPRWRATITKRIPVAAGPRRRQLRRRDRAPARERDAARAAPGRGARTSSPRRSARTCPFFLADGPAARPRRRVASWSRSTSRRTTGSCSSLPDGVGEDVDRRRLPPLRRARRRGRLRTSAAARSSARSRRSAARATSPRCRRTTSPPRRSPTELLAARRVPRRRQRRGPGRLRPLPPPPPCRGGAPRARGARPDLADGSALVRLTRAYGWPWTARYDRARHRPLRRAGCASDGSRSRSSSRSSRACSSLVGEIDWWVVVLVAIAAVALYVYCGRRRGAREAPRGVLDRRRLAVVVVLVPVLALVLTRSPSSRSS